MHFKTVAFFMITLIFFFMCHICFAQYHLAEILKVTNTESSYPFWSPDGSKIVFQSNRAGADSEIYIMNADGTNIERLTYSTADDLTPVWSPDGSLIAFQSMRDGNEELYIMNIDGSHQRNITFSSDSEMHPKWHPKGNTLIFSVPKGYWHVVDHWKINIDGTGLERITRSVTIDTYAEWSPDATKIVGRRIVESGNSEIFLFDADGSNPVNLTNDTAYDGWPSWHPNGEKIVYASEDKNGEGRIFELECETSKRTLLIDKKGHWSKPIWRRDGSKLICTRSLDGNVDIFVYDIHKQDDKKNPIKLSDIRNAYPSFSPDGKKIVFHSNRYGNNDIFLINTDGTEIQRLTESPAEDRTPSWSPDGSKIAFVSTRSGNYDVFVMNANGSEQKNLTQSVTSKDIHPYWSFDGKKIIFSSSRENNIYGIYEMKPDGSELKRTEKNGGENTHAQISPDGKKIVFRKLLENEDWKSDIFIMDCSGENEKRLTDEPGFSGYPSWSPDGSRIIFSSTRKSNEKSAHLYIISPDGSGVTRLTPENPEAKYTTPCWSLDGTKIVCTRTKDGNEDIVIINLKEAKNEQIAFTRIYSGRIVNDEGQSRGLAWGDYDNDGYADLYVGNTGGQWNFFYHNNGNGTFSKMRDHEAVNHRGFSEGVNWVDYDNDGDLDLFVSNTQDWEANTGNEHNLLFRNNSDSNFVQVTEGALVTDRTNSASACWADYDNDGLLEVFVVNRGDENDVLYHNIGNGEFERIITGVFVNNGGEGRSCAFGDVDGDEYLDLYVGNFRQRNYFYHNNGDGTFTEVTVGDFVTNIASTYGISFVDYDYDDDLDLFVTNIGRNDRNMLYKNDGKGNFKLTEKNPIVDHVKYSDDGGGASKGHTWGDFDNDGDLDLYIANGTSQPDMRNFLFLQEEGGGFRRIMEGSFVTDADISAGTAWADYDNDGDLDLFVANWGNGDQNNALYRNETTGNKWLSLQLQGKCSNHFGIGAMVRIKATINGKPVWQTRHMLPNTGYASQNNYQIHFGLGNAVQIDSLEIRWTSGIVDKYTNLKPNSFWIAVEGETLKPDDRKTI
ncbi:MAG: PD40 domain-containing protein [Candidatus Aminicenantes bacterium]|nr:PD40 domain-containing protein [Candidatus Aminicenantes bacterium]